MNVTVCITYHEESPQVLARAINSAVKQTRPPCELLIIDDGSRPEFRLQDIQPFRASHDVVVRFVAVTNRGLPAARNTGLMLAQGAAFLPLDADDALDLTYIEKTLPLLEAGADVVLTGLQEVGEAPRNQAYGPGFDRDYTEVDEQILWQYNRFFYCSLFRTQLLREVGGYNPMMAGWPGVVPGGYEDWDLWIDLVRRGVSFAAVNEPLLLYTTKADSMLTRAERFRSQLVGEMRRHHR